jgi:xylulokinase
MPFARRTSRPCRNCLRTRLSEGVIDAVLGVDVGTSSLKAGLFSFDGDVLGLARAAYPLSAPEAGAVEQDPEHWWTALATVTRQLMAQAERRARVAAVCIAGQAPTLVAADADFRATHAAISWLDQRPSAEADRLYARLRQVVPVWGSWPAQAGWFVRNRPAALARSRWLFGCPDYLSSRLTRTPAALLEVSRAERAAGELDDSYLPPIFEPGAVIGRVHAGAAAETHLPPGTPVVGGHVDGLLGVLGSGVQHVGEACMNGGTSGTLSSVCLPPLGYPVLGLNIAGSAANTSGIALDWFARSIASEGVSYDELFVGAADTPPGSDGLLFLPHLAGERAPERDLRARGAWVGLTLRHDRRHLLRALLEGVAFSFRTSLDWLETSGAPVCEVRCVGGQARSELWNQIKADVLNRPVLVPEVIEAAVVGAAMLAALGLGAYANLQQAVAAMVRISRRVEPDSERAALYDRLFSTYCALYPALRQTSWLLHDLSGHGGSPSSARRSAAAG